MSLRSCYGLKAIPSHLMEYMGYNSSTPLIYELYEGGWKIIYLRRENFFRHALSNQIGKQRGFFFYTQEDFKKAPKAHLDPQAVKNEYEARFKFKQDEDDALSGLSYKEIVYEQDLMTPEQREESLSGICHFLGMSDNFSPVVPFVKSTEEDLSQVVSNIDEINYKLGH